MLTTEQAAQNLIDYGDALDTSLGNVGEIRGEVGDILDVLGTVDRVIAKVQAFRDDVAGFNDDLGKLKTVLSLMEKASALRAVAQVGERVVDKVQDVLDRFEAELNKAVEAVEDSAIKEVLDRVNSSVSSFDEKLAAVEQEIADQQEAFSGVVDFAAKAATLAEEPIQLAGALVEPPLLALNAINALYDDNDDSDLDSVKEFLTDFSADAPTADFSAFLTLEAAMNDVFDALDFMRKPLDAVDKLLKPIEPLLAAADFVASLTVDPVMDFILDTLGVDDLLDAVEDKVDGFLPDTLALDGFADVFTTMEEALSRYDPLTSIRTYDHDRSDTTDEIADPFGVGEWVVENLEAKLLEAASGAKIGELSAEGIGIAIEIPDGVRGADSDDLLYAEVDLDGPEGPNPPIATITDLLMIGDDKDNVIKASGGKNVLYGAGGDDLLLGSDDPDPDAEDIAVFSGPIEQYRFSRTDLSSPVVIEHVSPIPGISLDGRDTLIGIEKVTFLGGASGTALTLDIDDLFDQVASVDAGGTLNRSQEGDGNGDGEIDSVFLFGRDSATPSTTTTVLVGGGGDDLISGTTGNDMLVGGRGDDDFRIRGGIDVVNGGVGSDTLSLFDDNGSSNANVYIDLKDREFVISGSYRATLISIENVLIDDARNIFAFGDGRNNTLTSAGRQDLIFGGRGSDIIFGRGDADVLIGGIGEDQLYGGAGGDALFAGDRAVRNRSSFYDGGDGVDRLSYSGDVSDVFNQQFIDEAQNNIADIQELRTYMAAQNSRSVIIHAGEGRVERLSGNDGRVLAVDTFQNIENFYGSDFNDILYGGDGAMGPPAQGLFGVDGDDILYAQATSVEVNGGNGDDLIIADIDRTRLPGYSGPTYVGGGGYDTLDLSGNTDVKWAITDIGTGSGRNAGMLSFLASESEAIEATRIANYGIAGFERYIGSDNGDRFDLGQEGEITVLAGGGNDFIKVDYEDLDTRYIVDGGTGDDLMEIWGTATATGGAGDDEIRVLQGHSSVVMNVDAGAGNDVVFVHSGVGHLDGGEERDADGNIVNDNDILSAFIYDDRNFGTTLVNDSGLAVNLVTGTVDQLSGDLIQFTIANFETIIGSDLHGDFLAGGAEDDRLIGAGGNDVIEGRALLRFAPDNRTYFSVPVEDSQSFGGSWTLEAVISTDDADSGIQRLISKPVGGAQTFSLAVRNGEAHLRFDTNGQGARAVQSGFVADGESHHIAGRYDAATQTLSLFVDQVKVAEISVAGAAPLTASGPVTVGNFSEDFPQPFTGEITGVRAWSIARSDDDLSRPYATITDPAGEPGLEIALRIRGDQAEDLSSNAYDLDIIDYSSGDDLLYGGAGTDQIYGGDGDDLLHPGGGSDDGLFGGQGNDTASFAFGVPGFDRGEAEFMTGRNDYAPVRADLEDGIAFKPDPEGNYIYLDSIENLIGTPLDDQLFGDAKDNTLSGGLGADLIDGRGGDDTIALIGDDIAEGGDGDDYFSLGAGNATISGGDGEDTLVFDPSGTVLYDLSQGIYRSEFAVQVPVWADGGSETRFDPDTGIGYTPQDVLETDAAYANSLDDVSRVIPDDPRFEIVIATEIQQFSGSFTGIEVISGGTEVNLVATTGDDLMVGLSGADTLDGLRGNDTLRGRDGPDILLGRAGDDIVQGGAGVDTLFGGDGNDRLEPGAGGSTIQFLFGQDGDDTYLVQRNSGNVVIDARAEVFGGGEDRVIFRDLTVADITVEVFATGGENGRSLQVNWSAPDGDSFVRVARLGDFVEAYEFADGTVLTADELLLL